MCDMKKIDFLINASEEQKAYLQSALMYSPICWKDGRFKFDREPCGKDCYTCTYKLVPDKSDKEYFSCMWARYIFDCDNGRLNINSDAGDYSYGWGHNDHEDFMHLMSRVNAGYLLNKISDRTVFDIDKSKARTVSKVQKYGIDYFGIKDQKQLESIVEEINDIDDGVSEETFLREVGNIVPKIDWKSIEIVKEYPCGATTVVDLFIKYLQPKIREEFYQQN